MARRSFPNHCLATQPPEKLRDEAAWRAVFHEIEILRRLDSPYCITLLDAFQSNTSVCPSPLFCAGLPRPSLGPLGVRCVFCNSVLSGLTIRCVFIGLLVMY